MRPHPSLDYTKTDAYDQYDQGECEEVEADLRRCGQDYRAGISNIRDV